MVPTLFGLLVVIGSLALMRRSITAMLCFALLISIFGAASALDLPALGGSSIQPAHLALAFVTSRILFSRAGNFRLIAHAAGRNIFLVAYCVYGAVTAFILPKLFAGAMLVVPLKPRDNFIYAIDPLDFSSQNITQAVYLLGTMMAALASTLVAARERRPMAIVSVAVIIAWAHVGFGILDAVLSQSGLSDVMGVVRNGSYAQLDQEVGGYKRLAGSFAEASSYAAFGFWWVVFLTELWLREIRPRATGPAALAVAAALFMSTSSTAYVGLGAYALVLILRILLMPRAFPVRTILRIFACILAGVVGVLALALANPASMDQFTSIIEAMTVNKMSSSSGLQRRIWARQGLDAFAVTKGLGIGAGSFRSSSFLTAVIGSSGVFGIVTMLGHMWKVFRPFAKSTHSLRVGGLEGVGIAAAWTVVLGIAPACVSAPGPDPGLLFGFFSGLALGWRLMPRLTSDHAPMSERALPQRPRQAS
jgi:hypothetical protein